MVFSGSLRCSTRSRCSGSAWRRRHGLGLGVELRTFETGELEVDLLEFGMQSSELLGLHLLQLRRHVDAVSCGLAVPSDMLPRSRQAATLPRFRVHQVIQPRGCALL